MHTPKKKLRLFLFIDAFGWEVSRRHPEFLNGLVRDSKPLETILGYSSACDPSIISGRTPSEHRLWSSFYYDPENSPFKWTRPLTVLPAPTFQRSRVRNLFGKWIKKRCGFTGYFQLYNVPFKHLHLFNYAEQKRIWEPGGLPRGTSIFDLMAQKGIAYHVHDSAAGDELRLERLQAQIQRQSIDFAYCSLGRLDNLMHTVGNDHPHIGKLMQWYDAKIRALLDAADENYSEVAWYLFSDHGMHNVAGTCNLMTDIEALGLEWNRDYVAFYDSTMARFWFLNETARAPLRQCLQNHANGQLLSDDELKQLGVWFADGQYGQLIFLMSPGIQIVPSFMTAKTCKGMQGYHPAEPASQACILPNRDLPPQLSSIRQIHELMLAELEE